MLSGRRNMMRIRPPYIFPLVIILVVINTLLSHFAAITAPVAPGTSALYFAVALMIPLALWFKVWGLLAAYLGCFLGAGLTSLPLTVNAYWSLADLWQVLIPFIALRCFRSSPGLKTGKDWLVFLTFGWIVNNLVGAAWGAGMLVMGGIIAPEDFSATFISWLGGNLIVTILIAPWLLKFVTPYVQKITAAISFPD
jgi:hypothetical protein